MRQTHRSKNLLETLNTTKREITLEIQLITAWIGEHRTIRPDHAEASSLSHKRAKLRDWRKVSYRLHQRRSELKTELENIRRHLRVVAQTTEQPETDLFCLPFLLDMDLEPEPASAGA